MSRYEASISRQQVGTTISRRAYNGITFGLVTVSFAIMGAMYLFASSPAFHALTSGLGSMGTIVAFVATLVLSIGGIVLMNVGKARESVGISFAGYAIFSLTFGLTTAIGLMYYNVGTIAYAFGITACLSGIFLILGVTFPEFFARIGRILFVGLIAVILVELVAVLLFHANQTIFDYLVIALFCGFLGYDAYRMASDVPSVPNAIWYASDIYLDIVNILLRVLSLLDRD